MATADSIRFRRSSLVKRVLQLLGSTLVVLAVMVAVFAIDSKELPVTVTGALVLPSHGSFPAGSQGTPAAIFPWIHQFGTNSSDFGNAVAVVGSDIYVAGSTIGTFPGEMNAGYIDAYVRKYDAMGTVVWTRQFGASWIDEALAVAADSSGVYVAGYTDHALPGQSTAGGTDAFVRKYDASGAEAWTQQFGTSGNDVANALAADPSGVYVVGATDGTLPGQTNVGVGDAFVRRYDSSGTEVWTRQFGTSSDDGAVSVAIQGSSVLVAGYTFGTFPGLTNQGSRDAFLRNYDASGTERWTRQVGTPADDLPYGVAADASAVYVAGYTYGAFPGNTNPGDQDAFLQSYDASGDERWIRQFGTSSFDVASAVAANSFGVYVAGFTGGTFPGQTNLSQEADAFVRKYDVSGTERWTRQIGTVYGDLALALAVSATGVFLAGYTFGTFPGEANAGGVDAFVARAIETPDAPTNLRASSGDGTADLTWNSPLAQGGSSVTSYRIYRGTTSGSLGLLVDVGVVQRYRDAGLSNGVTYYYAIHALNIVGEGPPSSEISATPGLDVTAPTVAITFPDDATILPSATVTLTGTASDDIAVEKVELSLGGATWVLASGTGSWSATLTLGEGSNTIVARATDTAGNVAIATITLTVKFPLPPPEGTAGLAIGLLAAGTILVATIVAALYVSMRRKRDNRKPPLGGRPPTK